MVWFLLDQYDVESVALLKTHPMEADIRNVVYGHQPSVLGAGDLQLFRHSRSLSIADVSSVDIGKQVDGAQSEYISRALSRNRGGMRHTMG